MKKNEIVHVVSIYYKKEFSKFMIFAERVNAEIYARNYNKNTDMENIAIVTSIALW